MEEETIKPRMSKATQAVIGVLVVIVALFVAAGIFMFKSISPYNSTRAQAIAIAQKNTDLKTPEAFDIATTDTTTYSVVGTDKSGNQIGVLVPKDPGKLTVVNLADGITPTKLTEQNTKSVVLALYKGQPAWEVNNSNGFKVYDFKTGKLLYS